MPSSARLAARALALYPAQTAKARIAKKILRFALRLGLKPGLRKVSAKIAGDDPFWRFLTHTAGLAARVPPRFAILTGNPRAPGRRFVLLLFNAAGEPAAIVKAGVSDHARHLLAQEENFLRTIPEGRRGVPELRASFDSPRVRAFALDFFEGESPGTDETAALADLLGSWIATDREVTMCDLGVWQRLAAATSTAPMPDAVQALSKIRFYPVISHGDFTPWNVKVAHGQWTVLDWERSEEAGVPGWDWIHFVVQPALLVRHESTDRLLSRLESLLDSAGFIAYAQRAGIRGRERELALAYLAYSSRVTKQTEGLDRLLELEAAAETRWFSAALQAKAS